MAKTHPVETELMKAAGLKKYKSTKRADQLKELRGAVANDKVVDDDVWKTLSAHAQNWSNAANTAVEKKGDVPEVADEQGIDEILEANDIAKETDHAENADESVAEEGEDADAASDENESSDEIVEGEPEEAPVKKKAAKTTKPVKPAPKVATKTAAKAPAKAAERVKAVGAEKVAGKKTGAKKTPISVFLKTAILDNHELTTNDAVALARKKGYVDESEAAMRTVVSKFRQSLDMLVERKLLPHKFASK